MALGLAIFISMQPLATADEKTAKPVLHGKHWVAVTGKPLAATAGAMIFSRGGNAVDAACAMLGATSTMWDTLGWGGETQALIYNPKTGEVKGINALGVAPTGATAELFREQGMAYPPEYGPLAAVTLGTLGGLITLEDLDNWQVHIEEPVTTSYKGIDVYKLTTWVKAPVMLQALNILEACDLKAMGYNSLEYIHMLYQSMNLAFADRDFYYGDPYVPPEEPVRVYCRRTTPPSAGKRLTLSATTPRSNPAIPMAFSRLAS